MVEADDGVSSKRRIPCNSGEFICAYGDDAVLSGDSSNESQCSNLWRLEVESSGLASRGGAGTKEDDKEGARVGNGGRPTILNEC